MKVVSSLSFFSPAEVTQLAATTGISQSSTFAKRQTQLLGFLQALGSRIGFPQRTIATAQVLLLRFHLFFNPSEFVAHEVAVACTVIASKINDTPKKARDVILSSWALRYPDLVKSTVNVNTGSSSSVSATAAVKQAQAASASASHTPVAATPITQQLGLGIISESDVDPAVLEKERRRTVSIESLLLQSITFNFNLYVQDNFRLTVKVARAWRVSQTLAKLAWQVCADCHRTYAPLSFPPSSISLASLYCAALLMQNRLNTEAAATPSEFELQDTRQSAKDVISRFQDPQKDDCEPRISTLLASIECIDEVVHGLLDLYIGAAPLVNASLTSNAPTPISPATPASPAEPLAPPGTEQHAGGVNNTDGQTRSRKLPHHVYSPPPFGVLFFVADPLAQGVAGFANAADMASDLLQIKIALRQAEEARQAVDNGERVQLQQGKPDLLQAAALVREFEIGGIRGDAEQPMLAKEQGQDLVEIWQNRSQDKQYASLQRFLF